MTTVNGDSPTPNEVLSHDNIFAEMKSAVSELEPLLPITPEQRQLLLLKFNWDTETLRNSFQEYADTNSFLIENGVCPKNTVHVVHKSECEICCSTGKILGLRCQHMACVNCWSKYLATKIRDDQCFLLECIEFGCGMVISNEMLGKFLLSSKLRIAHWRLIEDSYIKSDSSLAWCNRNCGKAVRRSNCDTVTCSCGSTFCFLCKSDAHYPATCLQSRLWEKQRMDSGQKTSSWILSNTRDCPRCFAPILKNGGCNHMKCTGCRHEYCWNCSHDWKTHPGFCTQFGFSVAQFNRNSRQHVVRYEHHRNCLKQDPRGLTDFRIQNILVESRRILMNSYVFGYYLKNGVYKSSFETHQQKLEIAVRELVFFKTGPRTSKLAEDCLTLRKALLDHCAKGAEHDNIEGPGPVKSVTNTNPDHWVEFRKIIIFSCFIASVVLLFLSLIFVVHKIKK